jgi:hypothetical protein
MINERLDNQLAFHKEIKNILTENQFEKWSNFQKYKMIKMHKKHDKFKGKPRGKIT